MTATPRTTTGQSREQRTATRTAGATNRNSRQEPATIGYLRRKHFCSIFLGWLLCMLSFWVLTAARGARLVWVLGYTNATTTTSSSGEGHAATIPQIAVVPVEGRGTTHWNVSSAPPESGTNFVSIFTGPLRSIAHVGGGSYLSSSVLRLFPCEEYGTIMERTASVYGATAVLSALCGIFITLSVVFVLYNNRNRRPFFVREVERNYEIEGRSFFAKLFMGLLLFYSTVVLGLFLAVPLTPLAAMTNSVGSMCGATCSGFSSFSQSSSLITANRGGFGSGYWLFVAAAVGQLLGTGTLLAGLITTWIQMKNEYIASMPQLTPVESEADSEDSDDDKKSSEGGEDDLGEALLDKNSDEDPEECCLICMRLRAGKQKALPDRRCASCKTGALYHTSCLNKWWAASKGKKFCPTCRSDWEDYKFTQQAAAPSSPSVVVTTPQANEESPLLPLSRRREEAARSEEEVEEEQERAETTAVVVVAPALHQPATKEQRSPQPAHAVVKVAEDDI